MLQKKKRRKKILSPSQKHSYYTFLQLMRPLCKLSSETGVQLVFFHICLIYGIEVNGSEARASTWCAELHYCAAMPLEYLVTMLDHKREPCCKNSSPSRSFLRGRIYGREIPPPALFPFSSSRKTGGGLSRFTRATSLSSTWLKQRVRAYSWIC